MSRKKSKRAMSPMEQGELHEESPVDSPSPEFRIEADDTHFTPEEDDEEEDMLSEEDAEYEENRRESPERSEDDTLDIKPPQQNSGKREKHKRKHKEDRKKDRDREKGSREKDNRVKSKDMDKDRGRDKRERDKEREEIRQKEERRRLKSLKERERLERLERERHRIDRERQRREQEHRDQLRRQEREKREREKERQDRAEKQKRKDDERRKRERSKHDEWPNRREKDRREDKRDERIVERSRSPYDRDRRDKDRDRNRKRDKDRGRDKYEERQRKNRRPSIEKSPEEEIHNQISSGKEKRRERERHVVCEDEDDYQEEEQQDEYDQEESVSEAESAGEGSMQSAAGSEVISGSEASVESKTESEDSESYSASDSERENQDIQERTPDYKRRSKFDDESEKESETESVQHSNEDNEDEYIEETPPESPIELKPELPPYFPAIQGCRPVDEFQCLNRIEEGTYGVVYRAVDKKSAEVVALKKLKMEKEKEGFPITSLREINTLLKAQHVNIVTVREIVVGSNMDKIFIVMDYVEHDLKSLMESMKEPFIIGEVKTLMIQLLRGVAHLHDNWIVHRDLKTSNLLLSHKGILKIGDFGLAREYGSPLKQYTPIVVTLWYRAPELLLGTKLYSVPIDMWSCGCIFSEFLTRKPLFPGKSEIDQLNRIFKELGTPNEKIWPGVSELPAMKKCTFADHPYNQLRNKFGTLITEKGFDLMNRFLTYNPERRITAEAALKHDYFKESPVPVDPSMFPTWPAKSEQPRRTHGNSPKPPSGGKAFSKLLDDDDHVAQSSGGFHLGTATKGASAAGAGFALKFGP